MYLTRTRGRVVEAVAVLGLLGPVLGAGLLVAPAASASPVAPSLSSAGTPAPGRVAAHGSANRKGWESVTVQLTPGSPAVVAALAQSTGISRQSRMAALTAAAPTAKTASAVAAFLRRAGLKVTAHTAFSISASGPKAVVDGVFPVAPRLSGAAAAGASPLLIPHALAGLALFVVGGADTARVAHPAQVRAATSSAGPAFTASPITGASARSLYSVPAAATTNSGQGIAVATIQLSGWESSNLTTFATNQGLPDPVASGQYQSVSVDGANPATPDGNGGDVEVALDQEALLTTAPKADQVAYVAPNTVQGFVDAFEAVATDALSSSGGHSYTALSVSWGQCEPGWSTLALNAMHAAIQDAVASGVTVFVASGDSGAYACSSPGAPDDRLEVSFPASDPNVLAVGGLTTDPVAKAETAWWNLSGLTSPLYLGSGGGGGKSIKFAQKSWQTGIYTGGTTRLLPDLSLDGDPQSGLVIRAQGQWFQVGGTSLSAPLGAATMTDLQIADGASSSYGLGNIARNLYAAPASSFRDTTSGTIGGYSAKAGYDLATGRGAPLWSKLNSAILGHPILSVPATSTSLTIPITVTVPTGMAYTGFKSGVGASTEPADCDPTGASVAAPTSVTATAFGTTVVWVMGYTASGRCFLSEAPVDVLNGGAASLYTALDPCRVFDTRTGGGSCTPAASVPVAPVVAGVPLQVQVAGVAGVPADATAVVLNVTAVNASTPGSVTVWPAGQAKPLTSNLNVQSAAAVPNLVVVRLGAGGDIDLAVSAGSMNLLADIAGYFEPTGAASYTSLAPCRVFDTRTGGGSCTPAASVPVAPVVAGAPLQVQVAGVAGVPVDATAVVLNVTAVNASMPGSVTVWPAGQAKPATSNLNVQSTAAVPNLVVVRLGAGGDIDLAVSAGSMNLLADLAGYFEPAGGQVFTALDPCRVFDTRTGGGSCTPAGSVPVAPVAAGVPLLVHVAGVAGVPVDASAVVLNVTAVNATAPGSVTVWPAGVGQPATSNLNVHSAAAVPNLVVVRLGAGGDIELAVSAGSVNLLADIAGYFEPVA